MERKKESLGEGEGWGRSLMRMGGCRNILGRRERGGAKDTGVWSERKLHLRASCLASCKVRPSVNLRGWRVGVLYHEIINGVAYKVKRNRLC